MVFHKTKFIKEKEKKKKRLHLLKKKREPSLSHPFPHQTPLKLILSLIKP